MHDKGETPKSNKVSYIKWAWLGFLQFNRIGFRSSGHTDTRDLLWMYITDKVDIRCHKLMSNQCRKVVYVNIAFP